MPRSSAASASSTSATDSSSRRSWTLEKNRLTTRLATGLMTRWPILAIRPKTSASECHSISTPFSVSDSSIHEDISKVLSPEVPSPSALIRRPSRSVMVTTVSKVGFTGPTLIPTTPA